MVMPLTKKPGAMTAALLGIVMALSLITSASMKFGHSGPPIAESAEQTQPLQVGDAAPPFIVETVDYEPFVFDPRALERPVMLVSFRGGWCPHCNLHLSELKHVIPAVRELGIDVIFLSGDRPGLLYESLKRETQEDIGKLNYRILSDADAQAAIALGIAFEVSDATIQRRQSQGDDIESSSMLRHGVLPVPSVFAVDMDGIVAFAYSNADYKVRLPADELMQVAVALAAPK